jgi:hypothetical protein
MAEGEGDARIRWPWSTRTVRIVVHPHQGATNIKLRWLTRA